MATAKKTGGTGNPRELVTPHEGDSRYQRRNDDGSFAEGDKVSRSQVDDKAKKSSTRPAAGQGDKGDHKPAAKKKG